MIGGEISTNLNPVYPAKSQCRFAAAIQHICYLQHTTLLATYLLPFATSNTMFSSAARTAASRFATRAAIASRPAVTAQPSAMTLRYFAGSVSQIFVLDTSNNLEVHVDFWGLFSWAENLMCLCSLYFIKPFHGHTDLTSKISLHNSTMQ